MKIRFLSFLFLLVFLQSRATIKLPAFIGSNMVLQQKTKAALWGWSDANKEIKVYTSWDKKTYTTKSSVNGQWKIMVATPSAGGPYTIKLTDGEEMTLENILIGEVWFASGQSNMEMPMKGFKNQGIKNSDALIKSSENKNIRLFTVKRADSSVVLDNCSGQWKQAAPNDVTNFSAVGYQFARLLQENLNVPVGIISSSWGGTPIEAWMSEESLKKVMEKESRDAIFQKRRSGLYNAMIHPLQGFGIAGFLWYQGEANRKNANVYAALMTAMAKDWRQKWNNNKLPFYFVQIAPMQSNNANNPLPQLWEAQYKALKAIPYSGMATTVDAGEKNNIHPSDKEAVARRLYLLAMAKNYGKKELEWSGPVYRKMKVQQDTVLVYFDHAKKGLTDNNKGLNLFEVAGDDKVFYKADAVITSTGVAIFSKEVKKPVAVRYAFKDWVEGDLYNKDGLPAHPFRTDNW